MMFCGQSMDNDCLGSDIPLMKLKPLAFSNDSESQFLSEVSRKRKVMDSLPDGKTYNIVSHPGNLIGSYGHLPTTDSNSPLPALTPPVVASHYRTEEFLFNNELISSRPTGTQFHFGDKPVCSMTSTLESMYMKGATFLESANSSCNSFEFCPKESPTSINVFASQVSVLNDSRSSVDDIASQTESSRMNLGHFNQSISCMETYLAARGSCTGMNLGYENRDLPSKSYPCPMTSSCLQSVEPYQMRMVNEYSDLNGGSLVTDLKESEILKENNNCWYTNIADDKNITKGTSGSAGNRGKKDHGSHQNVKAYITHGNHPDHLSVIDKEQNQKIMNHLPISVDPYDCAKTCLKDEKSKNSAQILMVSETRVLEDTIDSKHEDEIHSLESQNSVVELSDSLPSRDSDENIKSVAGKMFSVSTEKLWDGSLQLNTSTTVSAVAFFKSGEKAQDIRWSELVEVKGKVRLQAFEKFIQELPRSRTRALMVISLCWKSGSSISGLTGMKEVAKGYKESERVGFAQICPGIDLYVCPRSETIITILAKFGFFKGMAAVEEDQNSLIGCVVWRRSCQSKASDRKTSLVEQPLRSSEETLEMNSPLPKKQDEHIKQALLGTREPDGMPCKHSSETRSINAAIASYMRTESKLSESTESILHTTPSLPYNSPIAPVQIPPPQKLEFRSRECLKSPILHGAEGRQTDCGSEPAQSVLLQSPQVLLDSHQRSITYSENFNRSGYYPKPHMRSAPPMSFSSFPVQLQTTQRPYSSSQENPTISVSQAENYVMRFKESNTPTMSSELSQITLPGPPPLPPEVLEKIIQSRAAVGKETSVGVFKAEIPIGHVSEPKKSSMIVESIPIPPGPPPSLPQALSISPSPVDVDDLPEFDFNSACEVLESSTSKYPWSSHPIPDVPPFVKKLQSDLGKNPTTLGSTTIQSIEVIQRQQFSSSSGDSIKNYQRSPIRSNFEKPIVDNKVAVRTSLSHDQPSLDADKGSVGPSRFLRKHRWDDDDDDMPEWCPPDLECVDQSRMMAAIKLPSPVHNRNPEFARQGCPLVPPSSTSLCSPISQGLPRGYLHGTQGPPPPSHNPIAVVQTRPAAGFDHFIQRPPSVQNTTNMSCYQTGISNKRPSDIGSRFQRP